MGQAKKALHCHSRARQIQFVAQPSDSGTLDAGSAVGPGMLGSDVCQFALSILLGLIVLAALFFSIAPTVDLAVSGLFADVSGGFPMQSEAVTKVLRGIVKRGAILGHRSGCIAQL